jgi:uncharacterized membrane protein
MRVTSATWIATLLVAACAAVAIAAWIGLPNGVPINYLGLDGHRHQENSRYAFGLIPLIAAFVTATLILAPTLGARRGVERAAKPFDMTVIGIAGLLLVVEVALVGRALDPAFNVMRPAAIATGVLLLGIGNYLGKARQNAVFGLRTPWTLADATVWDKTHRFAGRGMVLGGLVLMALGFLLHDGNALGVSIAVCTALPLLAAIVRSHSLYRTLQRG